LKIRWAHISFRALLSVFVASAHTQISQPNTVHELGGISWQLLRFEGGDGKTLAPDDKTNYTIVFARDGSVSLRLDCNRGRATWQSAGPSQLQFSPLALTSAMYSPAPLDRRIPKDWQYVRSYVLKEDHLFRSLMADGGTYEFESIGQNGTANAPTISGLPATFVGIWPCADCPGIRYQVNLFPDHTFISRMIYQERAIRSDDHGRWSLASDGKTLVLQGRRGPPEEFALHDIDTLRKLDASGHEIQTKLDLNYDLKRAPKSVLVESSDKEIAGAFLENTYWKLTRLGDVPVKETNGQREPHLVLNSEMHRMSGFGGCNRLTGSYILNGDSLTFGQVVGTMMACLKGMQTEKSFLQAFSQVNSWIISGQNLEFYDTRGKRVASFEALYMK
jgi:copper homeostasis protein (lipoprotein)